MMWKQLALVACVLLSVSLVCAQDPLAELSSLAQSAPSVEEIEHADLLIELQKPAAPVAPLARAEPIARIPATGTDDQLKVLGSLSEDLSVKKEAVEAQRNAIQADESKMQRLRRIIAENKEILVRNERTLAATSQKYLGAVQDYTSKVNQAVAHSLEETQNAAKAQVEAVAAEIPEARSMLSTDSEAESETETETETEAEAETEASTESQAAAAAEAHLAAEHAAQFQRLVEAKMNQVTNEYAQDLAAHHSSIPKNHQNDLTSFLSSLKIEQQADNKRTAELRESLHTPAPQAKATPTPIASDKATIAQEMQGEPVIAFLETEEMIEQSPDAAVDGPYVPPTATTTPDAPAAPATPATPTEDGPKLVKPTIEVGTVGLPEPVRPAKKTFDNLKPCPKKAAAAAALLEVEGDAETESESDADVDVDVESDEQVELEAEAAAEFDAESESKADALLEAEMDADLEQFAMNLSFLDLDSEQSPDAAVDGPYVPPTATTTPDAPAAPATPATPTEDGPKLVKPTIEVGTVGLPEPVRPAKKTSDKLKPCPK